MVKINNIDIYIYEKFPTFSRLTTRKFKKYTYFVLKIVVSFQKVLNFTKKIRNSHPKNRMIFKNYAEKIHSWIP